MAPLLCAALTSSGVALDFDDGSPVSFEYSKESSPSHAEKEQTKSLYRMLNAAKVAHQEDEINMGLRFTELGESVKMWIRTWPGIGMDEAEVHLAIAAKQLRRITWFEYKSSAVLPTDGVYQIDSDGIVHSMHHVIEVARDGPALTLDGTVVDLDGGHKTFFSHSKELSPSHEVKQKAKEDFRMMRAAELAHYSDEVLMGYRVPGQTVICADDQKTKNVHTPKNKLPFQSLNMKGDSIFCVDAFGIVQTKGIKTPPELAFDDAPRFLSEPDAELSPQNPGASPEPCALPVVECI